MCAEKYLMVQKPAFCICGTFCLRVVVCVCKSLFRMALLAILHFPALLDTFIEIYRFISTADSPYPSWTHICMQLTLFFCYFSPLPSHDLALLDGQFLFVHSVFVTQYLKCFFFSSVFAPPPPPLSFDLSSACEDHKSVYPHWTPTQPAHCALTLFHDSTWPLFISFGSSDWHHFLEEVTTLWEKTWQLVASLEKV